MKRLALNSSQSSLSVGSRMSIGKARLHPLAQRIEDLGVARRVRRHVAKPCAIMYGNQPTPASLF
ncbi:MAG TPA: hypothetical protein VFP38_02275, partial [Bradyrhizobium sp.]|nr:hypothetical protein [Bradyrhizobium sp.]